MKRLCKILILLICNLFILNPVFSENKDLLTKVLDAKLHTRVCESPEAALVYLKDFKASLEAENAFADKDSIDCITLSNLLNNEIYIYMYETDASIQELKDFILAQYNEIEEWKSNHGEDEYTQWFILSTWDVVNQTMQFIPQTTAIRLGLKEKQEYDSLVQKYPDFSFGYMNAALWYYFAPAIGGGSKTVALNYLLKAVETASYDYEKFYSRIFCSQALYDKGDKETCKKLLEECDSVLPNNVYIPFIRFLNDNGFSLLYYTNNRDKVEKKIGKYKKN